MNMLKELEKLLSDIAEQQAAPSRRAPQAGPPVEPEIVDSEIADAEIVEDAPRQRPRRRTESQSAHRTPRPQTPKTRKPPEPAPPPEPPPVPEAAEPGFSHEDFDQQLKQHDARDGSQERAAAPGLNAAEIAQWFNDVGNVRQAIIMSEILNRPTHRWK